MNSAARGAALAIAGLISAPPDLAHACACGCGVFDVGVGALMPTNSRNGFSAWFRFSDMDQTQNWEGASRAPAADNPDKEINTRFYTVGGQYMFNRQWAVMAELPIYDRDFTSTDDGTVAGPAGAIDTRHITAAGDLQLTAVYTGLASDMTSGLSLGVKLPTGAFRPPLGPLGGEAFDRDTMPGTGSTDLMLGGYHVGAIGDGGRWGYFVQGRYQFAIATQDGYRPGDEFDSAAGISYNLGSFGRISNVVPVLQLINSLRARDAGANSDPENSGYERLLIAPGVTVRFKAVRFYAEVALPLYQRVNASNPVIEGSGGQLTAPVLFKLQATYSF